ncbi:phage tail protein [Klebsiella sp. BIGb0407]|uniref:phage tail protein n=1 Tax=Klebsiella sp. BIGb0407 TaxID=2940603 RepID=UPI00216817E8|nr:phage tail protein [Klebsiella sp. BIGb0407]MCS3433706.1 phage-related protein [Klebsiella sp. BIGb0407]
MTIETFMWPTQVAGQPATEYNQTIRKAQFGDGYSQVSEDGINSEQIKFPYSYRGPLATAISIRDFCRRHRTKSFIWTPPHGEKGLYRVDPASIRMVPNGKTQATVSANFEQAYSA